MANFLKVCEWGSDYMKSEVLRLPCFGLNFAEESEVLSWSRHQYSSFSNFILSSSDIFNDILTLKLLITE